MNLLDRPVGFVAIRTMFGLLALVQYLLERARPSQNVCAWIPHLSEHGLSFRVRQEHARAGLADALQQVESVLEVTDVETGQGQANVSKVSGAIGQFEFARGAGGCLVGHAQAGVEDAAGCGSAGGHGEEIAGGHLELGQALHVAGREETELEVRNLFGRVGFG